MHYAGIVVVVVVVVIVISNRPSSWRRGAFLLWSLFLSLSSLFLSRFSLLASSYENTSSHGPLFAPVEIRRNAEVIRRHRKTPGCGKPGIGEADTGYAHCSSGTTTPQGWFWPSPRPYMISPIQVLSWVVMGPPSPVLPIGMLTSLPRWWISDTGQMKYCSREFVSQLSTNQV